MKKFDRSQLLPRFKTEVKELLRTLNQGLLKLEKNSKDKALIEHLMRTAHTLKGSSVIAGFKRIADLAHKFEDCITEVSRGKLKPKDEHFNLLFQVLDSVGPLLESKISWPEKGVAYPHVVNLERKLNSAFGLKGEKAPIKAVDKGASRPEFALENGSQSIRVDVGKLDNLVNLAGELVINKMGLAEKVEEASRFLSGLEGSEKLTEGLSLAGRRLSLVSSELQEAVMSTRMLSVSTLFTVFPRSVRDLSKQEGKIIETEIKGADTELDRSVLQEMEDPMMHLVRNAVTHGIERCDEREQTGKPREGKITLSAYQQGGLVVIEVSDDGRGIDSEVVKKKALEKNIITQQEAGQMSLEQILQLIFAPGFTTQETATQEAGRGVGLDAVRTNVTKLKGQMEVSSEPGKGTKFIIKLPLTLAIAPALTVKTAGQAFAIPMSSLEETTRITDEDIGTIGTREAVEIRDKIIPLARLHELLKLEKNSLTGGKYHLAAIVRSIEKQLAIVVDEFLGRQDIVVKGLGDHLGRVDNIAGSTILGDGRVALILDVAGLIETAATVSGRPVPRPEAKPKEEAKYILIAEDSVTTAQSEQLVLESAGYKVAIAKDGREALEKMAERRPDLVVTDIVMPNMDGLEMVGKMRESNSLNKVPVIIVSGKDDENYRRRGLALGVDAYIIKAEFDPTAILEKIEKLIG